MIPYRPILATDALLGNKYIYSRVPVFGCEMIQENIFNDIDVYYNPYALKLGYQIADRKAINNFSNNAFENQEILFSNFTGKSVDLYSDSEILSKETDYTSWTEWKIKTKKSGAVYAYFINNLTDALVYVNNECIGWTAWFDKPMLYLGEYDEGETLRLKVYHEGGGYQENYGLCVATLDMKQFENVISIFSTQTCHIKEMKDGYLKAEYDCKKEGTLMLTIPYENGWTLKVNGQDQPLKKVANIFMGVDIEKGKNIIELKYNVPGKALGMILSGIGFLLFFVWEYMVKRIENQRRERKKCYQ